MKLPKTYTTVIITVIFGIILLTLQEPVTDALVKKSEKIDAKFSPIYSIKNTYNLPEILNEISGITWIGNHTFACVQDEDGFIYIYNTVENKIEEKIEFGTSGDYEAIAIHEDDAYVMRSDGLLYEIKNYRSEDRAVSKTQTPFDKKNNIESLTYDKTNKRLLTAAKTKDLGEDHIKAIYQISIDTKEMDSLPLIEINLKDTVFNEFQQKKIRKTFKPSDIAIHPKTNDIYVLEGTNPKLAILNSKGKILKVLPLDKRKFGQPEGITFSNDGRLFISNEDTGNGATILEVELN